MARDELEYQRRQDALARADRLAEVNALAQYRAETLAQNQAQLAQQVAEFDAGADQRAATLEGTNLDNQNKRIANQTAGITLQGTENTIIRNQYNALELVDPANPAQLDKGRIAEGFRTGNKPIIDTVMFQITSQLNIPKGSEAVGIDKSPDGQGFVVRIQNADGSIGVLTEDGTSNPDSKVQVFTPESLAKFAEWGYQTGVIANSDINMGEFRAMEGVIRAGFQNEADVVTALPPQTQRAAVGVILSAETDEERAQVTDALAQDAGLTPRAQTLLEERRRIGERGKLGGNQESATARIAEIDAELSELGFSSSTRAEAAQTIASTENLTGPQINEAVESGALTVTPELQRETADMMRNAGVNELSQLNRLQARQLALAKAVLMASTTDATLRNNLANQIDNIIETGSPSMSRKDVIDDAQQDRTADQRDRQLDISEGNLLATITKLEQAATQSGLARTDAMVDGLEDLREETRTMFFDDEGNFRSYGSKDTADTWTQIVLPKLQAQLSKIALDSEGRPVNKEQIGEFQALQAAITQGVSLSLAAYANNFDWISFLGVIPVPNADVFNVAGYAPEILGGRGEADKAAVATDFVGDRIELTTKNGNPDTFYYLDANGERTDRGVPASEIEKLNKTLYRWMVRSSKTRAQGGN